ncbi:MAG: outer membrane lipoprotein-sorting protein [Flavobacteriales bacterium]|nr:outer membrane lipoprotein-sorting protein [Flavobacteriales bacterium]
MHLILTNNGLNRKHVSIVCALLFSLALSFQLSAQDPEEIIRKAEEKLQGEANLSVISMTIVRPDWTREMVMKSWSKDYNRSLILITSPERDKGTAFLKRDKEMWFWQSSIGRVIELPPSMMMQSWMGSDFMNDDLVKESSSITDYMHTMLPDTTIDGRICYQILLMPKEETPVVWGKVQLCIDKVDYIQVMSKMYDEDGYLINTMYGLNIKEIGGRVLPTRMEMIPAEEEGFKTIIEYKSIEFDIELEDEFFSIQNMKMVR